MNSLFEKHRLQVLCVLVAAFIVAIGAITAVCLDSRAANAQMNSVSASEEAGHADIVSVTVKADGNTLDLLAAETTVKEVLESHSIRIGKHDIVVPDVNTAVTDGMEISIQRVDYKKETSEEKIPYETEIKGVDTLPQGESRVVTKGVDGKAKVTYEIKYVDGEEVARTEVSREIVEAPVTEVIEESTIGKIEGREYSRSFTVKAYSYTGGGRTASGKPAAVGRIAVDPRVIPLGTQVYVEGYGFAEAADTGGNIKGNTIDVYYNSVGQCRQWGMRYVTIYILK